MRIVQFPYTTGVVVYPEEGIEAFGQTTVIPGFIVGEYFGEQTDPTLPDYPGEWPIPLPPAYLEEFTPAQLLESFTSSEIMLAGLSADPVVEAQMGLLSLRRDKTIRSDDVAYTSTIDLLVSEGILTADVGEEYKRGVPASRISS